MQEYVHFLYLYNCFADIPYFFSRARSTAGEGGTEKISALVSALVSAPVSALYMSFESQGWTALFDLVDTVGSKA